MEGEAIGERQDHRARCLVLRHVVDGVDVFSGGPRDQPCYFSWRDSEGARLIAPGFLASPWTAMISPPSAPRIVTACNVPAEGSGRSAEGHRAAPA
jgi:hypothetical protein